MLPVDPVVSSMSPASCVDGTNFQLIENGPVASGAGSSDCTYRAARFTSAVSSRCFCASARYASFLSSKLM